MTHKELLVVAQELGIVNAESLVYNDLKKAVSAAKKAKALEGNSSSEQITPDNEANTQDVDTNQPPSIGTETPVVKESSQEKLSNTGEFIGEQDANIQNGDTSQSEDITAALGGEEAAQEPVTYYEDDSGRKYCFSAYTPDKFRFNSQVKTQEDWLQDKEAMEQLVFGNCTYVQQIFND